MYLLKMFMQQISSTHTPQNTLNLILDTAYLCHFYLFLFFYLVILAMFVCRVTYDPDVNFNDI